MTGRRSVAGRAGRAAYIRPMDTDPAVPVPPAVPAAGPAPDGSPDGPAAEAPLPMAVRAPSTEALGRLEAELAELEAELAALEAVDEGDVD